MDSVYGACVRLSGETKSCTRNLCLCSRRAKHCDIRPSQYRSEKIWYEQVWCHEPDRDTAFSCVRILLQRWWVMFIGGWMSGTDWASCTWKCDVCCYCSTDNPVRCVTIRNDTTCACMHLLNLWRSLLFAYRAGYDWHIHTLSQFRIQYVRGFVGFRWVRRRSSGCFGRKPYFKGMQVTWYHMLYSLCSWNTFVRCCVLLWTIPVAEKMSCSQLCAGPAINFHNANFRPLSLTWHFSINFLHGLERLMLKYLTWYTFRRPSSSRLAVCCKVITVTFYYF